MGLVTRPIKINSGASSRTYVDLVAEGGTIDIEAADVDGDVAAIITQVNGGLDVNNLADNAVTTAKITDQNVTVGKLGVNATQNNYATAAASSGLIFTNTETDIVTLPSITTRGGRVLLIPTILLRSNVPTSASDDLTIRYYRNAGVLFQTVEVRADGDNGNDNPFAIPVVVDTPAAGSYIYRITAETGSTSTGIVTHSTNPGNAFVIELA